MAEATAAGPAAVPARETTQPSDAPVLAVHRLETHFSGAKGPVAAIQNVSFEIRRGETLGLVGESGSGKSVTALSILQLLPKRNARIAAGSVRLLGEELVGASEARMRELRGNAMGIVFQEPMTSLNPVLRIGWQIGEAVRRHQGLRGEAARERILEILRLVRIPEPERRLKQFPFELSGGMRQRVMIAIALACRPALLIADEATTALDVTIQAQILQLIADLQKELGMGVLMITHDLGVVAETCDRVCVMYAGEVVESGSVAEIFERPLHPYTKGLLNSIPRLPDPGRPIEAEAAPLPELPGQVPALTEMPAGCRFADRCPYVQPKCRETAPPLTSIDPMGTGSDRKTACYEYQRLLADTKETADA